MGSNPAGDLEFQVVFLPVLHSSSNPIPMKSSMKFIMIDRSIEIDILILKMVADYMTAVQL